MSPLLRRPCPGCKVVLIASPATRCSTCMRAKAAARGTTTERGLGWTYQKKRARILARDGYVCWLCGQPDADSVDHVVPRVHGGDDTDANLRAAHLRCNSSRGARNFIRRLQNRDLLPGSHAISLTPRVKNL
jgi:5-methylcytosine-specific restriction endonuclease McrA